MIMRLKDVLEKVVDEGLGLPKAFEEYRISDIWKQVNTQTVTSNSEVDKFAEGVLYIRVKNSAWAQQLSLLKASIMQKLNEKLGKGLVKDIRARTGVNAMPDEKVAGEAKTCPKCGTTHFRKGSLCSTCTRQKGQSIVLKLIRLVEHNKMMSFNDAKKLVPEIDEIDFHRAMRDMSSRDLDQKYLERKSRGRKKQ